jgi:hypothetical protein
MRMSNPLRVTVKCDASALQAVFDKLRQAPKLSEKDAQALSCFLDDPAQVLCIDVDQLPTSASELRFSLQPTDRFLEFVSALLAGNVDLD